MAIALVASSGAWAQTSGTQSTTPAPQGASSTPASTSTYPPSHVVQFYIAHPDLFKIMKSTDADGKTTVTGADTNHDAIQEAMDKSTQLDAASKEWIEKHELQVDNNNNNTASNSDDYIAFKARLAVLGESARLKENYSNQLELAKQLDAPGDYIRSLEGHIQDLQNQIDASRGLMLNYAADAIRAERQAKASGGSSADASGSGSNLAEDQQTTIVPVDTMTAEIAASIDRAIADASRAGDAIARAYLDPTGILNGPNRALTKAETDAFLDRIRIALMATSATPVGAQAGTDDFTGTAASSPITVATLNPIYQNYRVTVGPNGALVVSVPTLQVRTPTGVMTIPSNQVVVPSTQLPVTSTQITMTSTQVNTPSPQVDVPSTQVNVPSTQVTVPSTQMQTPSSVMTSPDLQPSLCGR